MLRLVAQAWFRVVWRPLRVNEFVAWVPDRQNRAGCSSDDVLCNAPEQQMRNGTVSVRAHHDDVDVLFLGVPNDLDERATRPHSQHKLRGLRTQLREGCLQLFFRLVLHPLDQLRRRRHVVRPRCPAPCGIGVLQHVDQVKRGPERVSQLTCIRHGDVCGFAEVGGEQDVLNHKRALVVAASVRHNVGVSHAATTP